MTLDTLLRRIKQNCEPFQGQFPTVGDGTRYRLTVNDNWLAGFWPGLLWLTYAHTRDQAFAVCAQSYLASFRQRLDDRVHITHDLGFLYTLSARAQWQLTGNEEARALALRAADELSQRYRPNGRYIQAWGAVGDPEQGGRAIIDTMMNLALLYWATDQTGSPRYAEIATAHADTTAQYLVREDGGSYHTFFFDQETGEPIGPQTHQGYADDSLWARGQSWVIFGFVVAAAWTGNGRYTQTAYQAAERFMAELPENKLPLWDLRLPPGAPHYPDTSASAIAAAGMLRLAGQLEGAAREQVRQHAGTLLNALNACCLETDPAAQGLLRGGTYHAHKQLGVDEYFICGDYYYLEALLMQAGHCPDFWGKPTA
ncbi:MAG: glycoside hydrolase family 88 protein [Anaerolineae bacterium]|nr:glycoside hydrolase family 88 protein [Anaerolineae bacterium]